MIAKTHQIVYLKMTKMIGFTLFFVFCLLFFCFFFLNQGLDVTQTGLKIAL